MELEKNKGGSSRIHEWDDNATTQDTVCDTELARGTAPTSTKHISFKFATSNNGRIDTAGYTI